MGEYMILHDFFLVSLWLELFLANNFQNKFSQQYIWLKLRTRRDTSVDIVDISCILQVIKKAIFCLVGALGNTTGRYKNACRKRCFYYKLY